jgi:hypothetical protein
MAALLLLLLLAAGAACSKNSQMTCRHEGHSSTEQQ